MGGHNTHGARLKLIKSPIVGSRPAGSPQPYDAENGKTETSMFETPEFQRHEEATSIELFYDLFFVANLTTFTDRHEINGSHTLKAYAGFFCILWFTWCQVSLFDVRYVSDGVLERCLKACQFAIMVGLAVVGPKFDPDDQEASVFRALSLILAASRLILSIQYLIVMFHVKKYKKSKTPLSLIALSTFLAGLIYLAIAFAFKEGQHSRAYAAWYVIAVIEIGVNITVSSKWKVVSFKGTHLVQRMSLLTLIILGEGIIAVLKAIGKIVADAEFAYSAATVGNITAAIAMIYFLYMLYFDWLNLHSHFGSIRQQIWAFLHFPFHLFLVLGLEGTSQVIVIRKLEEAVNRVANIFTSNFAEFNDDSSYTIDQLVNKFNETVENVWNYYPPKEAAITEVQNGLIQLHDAKDNQTQDDAMTEVLSTVITSVYETYGIELRENAQDLSSEQKLDKYSHVFRVLFVYFFGALGATVLLMNILNYLSISHRSSGKLTLGSWLRLAFNTVIGIALCAVAGIARTEAAIDYLASPWALPSIAITLFIMLIVNNIRKTTVNRGHNGKSEHVNYQPAPQNVQLQPLVHNAGYPHPQPQPYQPYGAGGVH